MNGRFKASNSVLAFPLAQRSSTVAEGSVPFSFCTNVPSRQSCRASLWTLLSLLDAEQFPFATRSSLCGRISSAWHSLGFF